MLSNCTKNYPKNTFYQYIYMRDNTHLQQLRPILQLDNAEQNTLLAFQNEVLRPILKFQHEIFIQLFAGYLTTQNISFEKLDQTKIKTHITQIIQKNTIIRQQCIGIVIGLFTTSEFQFFLENQQDIQKRIANMLIERLCSVYLS